MNGNNCLVPWDSSVWLPKYGEDMEVIEGISLIVHKKILTAISIEHCILNDHMRCWRVIFGTVIHSSWATFDDVMAIPNEEGVKIDLVIYGIDTS